MQKTGITILIALLVIGAGTALLYTESDWRFSENWLLVKTGLVVVVGEAGADVYLDEVHVGAIPESGTLTIPNVLPGTRALLVALSGRWPWTKDITVPEGGVAEAKPFLVHSSPTATVLAITDPEYAVVGREVLRATLPTPEKPLASPDGNVEVFVRGNTLGATWRGTPTEGPSYLCGTGTCEPVEVLEAKSPMRNIAFFGERNDVVIIAITNGIFALDLNREGTQNFQSLYLGNNPVFADAGPGLLYIKDGQYHIKLEY